MPGCAWCQRKSNTHHVMHVCLTSRRKDVQGKGFFFLCDNNKNWQSIMSRKVWGMLLEVIVVRLWRGRGGQRDALPWPGTEPATFNTTSDVPAGGKWSFRPLFFLHTCIAVASGNIILCFSWHGCLLVLNNILFNKLMCNFVRIQPSLSLMKKEDRLRISKHCDINKVYLKSAIYIQKNQPFRCTFLAIAGILARIR